MKRKLLLMVLLVFAGGCAGTLAGRYDLIKATPNRDMFAIDNALFRGDGTYEATVTIDGMTTRESGKFQFNGFRLTLQPDKGGRRVFDASKPVGGTLRIWRGKKEDLREVVLRKE